MDALRVAATRLDTRLGDLAHEVGAHRRLTTKAVASGCALVDLPGLSTGGHPGDPRGARAAGTHAGLIACAPHGLVSGHGPRGAHRRTHRNTCAEGAPLTGSRPEASLLAADPAAALPEQARASSLDTLRTRRAEAYEGLTAPV